MACIDLLTPNALQAVCLFENNIGFFAAATAGVEANLIPKKYFHVFEQPNLFNGPIRKQARFATHTFDIVTMLGGVHEDRLPESYKPLVITWRDEILGFVVSGKPPYEEYIGEKRKKRRALMVNEDGVGMLGRSNGLRTTRGGVEGCLSLRNE